MVDIQSKEVIDKVSDELKIQPAMEIPRELAKQIQLVYKVNPEREIRPFAATVNDSQGGGVFTTHAIKRTFLVGATLTVSKDVVSTSLNSLMSVVPKRGGTTTVLRINYEPVTAGNHHAEISFPPMELEKASAIILSNSTSTASIDTHLVFYFYETDPQ